MRHDHPAPFARFPWLFAAMSGLFFASTAAAVAAETAQGAPRERGVWFNNSGRGAVEIRPCGATGRDANYLCGFIVWLKEPNNKKGEALRDGYNADPRKRTRPICGLPVLGSLRPMSDGSWDQGWVYDPEQGKSFDAAIALHSPDRLILTGYKGVKFFSKSFVWKRAPDDLPRCDNTANAATVRPASAKVGIGTAAGPALPPLPDKASLARATRFDELVVPRPIPAVRQPPTPAR
jgi:uncharacterized protein (DUF2147 family)